MLWLIGQNTLIKGELWTNRSPNLNWYLEKKQKSWDWTRMKMSTPVVQIVLAPKTNRWKSTWTWVLNGK